MKKNILKILYLEDSPQDVEIISELIIDAGIELNMDDVATEKEFISSLQSSTYDIILADHKLPGFDSFAALERVLQICPDVPLICVSGKIGEEAAVKLMKLGAVDYIMKDRPTRLPVAVTRALEESKEKVLLRHTEEALRQTLSNQLMTVEILKTLNRSNDLNNIVRDIMITIKKSLEFDAVAIRLQENADFPYFSTNGFPQDFVTDENYLCMRDAEDNIIKDSNGDAELACLCGRILKGKTDPALHFFTPGGSFWTNSITDLLASTPENQRIITRNKCTSHGFESIALIPIRIEGGILGLLQLNDRKRDRFNLEMIEFLEGLAASIGVALNRNLSDEKLQKGLHEKAILLKELYHRTKNNMQIICSLLRMQSTKLEDKRTKQLFQEVESKIYSMALVQQKLLDSKDLSHLDLDDYLAGLIIDLKRGFIEIDRNISFQIKMENISITVETAMPLGLVFIELVINSIKHAFPDKKSGTIEVKLYSTPQKEIIFEVSDNGIGFPEGFDIDRDTNLGLKTTIELVKFQLNGTIHFESIKGVHCKIMIQNVIYKPRV
jgi:two-component sensor histidine kinase/CheY-like chemotaxis protein